MTTLTTIHLLPYHPNTLHNLQSGKDEKRNEHEKSIRVGEKEVRLIPSNTKQRNQSAQCAGKTSVGWTTCTHTSRKSIKGTMGSSASAPNLQTVESHLPQQPQSTQEVPVVYPAVMDGDNFEHQPDQNWSSIRTHHCILRPIQDVYNFRLIGPSAMTVNEALRVIFHRLRYMAKINLSFGFILHHLETGELRYFHPSQNNGRVFSSPETIASEAELNRLVERVREMDVLQMGFHRRPDTKWTVAATTNATIYVNKLTRFPIGSPVQEASMLRRKQQRPVESCQELEHWRKN